MHDLAVIIEENLRATGRQLAHIALDTRDAGIGARHRVAAEIIYEGSQSYTTYREGYRNGIEESSPLLPSSGPVWREGVQTR